MSMKTLSRIALPLLALSAIATSRADAQALTLEQAKTAMDAAEAEARRNSWNLTIVVAGADGIPVYLRRMDGASPRSYDIAMGKVRTALAAGMATGDYGQALAAGRVTDTIPRRAANIAPSQIRKLPPPPSVWPPKPVKWQCSQGTPNLD